MHLYVYIYIYIYIHIHTCTYLGIFKDFLTTIIIFFVVAVFVLVRTCCGPQTHEDIRPIHIL